MVSGLFFNVGGVSHSLSVSFLEGFGVWRGVVDGVDVVFWDSGVGFDDVDLVMVFNGLVDAYKCLVGECGNE